MKHRKYPPGHHGREGFVRLWDFHHQNKKENFLAERFSFLCRKIDMTMGIKKQALFLEERYRAGSRDEEVAFAGYDVRSTPGFTPFPRERAE